MRTIDDLIDALSTSPCSIEDALIKAQVLAHQLGDQEMAAWAKAELTGYPVGVDVPDYRVSRLNITGSIGNGYYTHVDQTLPLSGLTNEQAESLTLRRDRKGVGAIEHLAKQEDAGKQFRAPIPPEWFGPLSTLCSEGYSVQQAWACPAPGAPRQILTQIRSRLLDFALQLKDRVPVDTELQELKTVVGSDQIRSLFENAMGSNITVILNSGAIGTVTTEVRVLDVESLKVVLSQEGITSERLDQLESAIAIDSSAPEHKSKQLGTAVLAWIGETTKTAIKAGTETVIKAALRHYYGF